MTPEEILKNNGITEQTKHHNYNYLYHAILIAMEEYAEHKYKNKEADGVVFCGKCGTVI